MKWVGEMVGIRRGRVGLGEDFEYLGRYGFTIIKGGRFLKGGKNE